jgi:hypothetical protein
MPTITLPNTWRADEAKAAARASGLILARAAASGVRSEPLAILRTDLRALAQTSLVGRPNDEYLTPVEASAMSNVVRRVIQLAPSEAARAGAPRPPLTPLVRVLRVAAAREVQQGLAGALSVL